MEHECRMKFVLFHFKPNFNLVLVSKLIKLGKVLETDYLVFTVSEAKEKRTFSVFKSHVYDFKFNQSA